MKVYLVRHCETQTNVSGGFYKKGDVFEFSETGKRQLDALKQYFADHQVKKLYTSPLKRCLMTAEQLAPENVVVVDLLRDLDPGDFSGLGRDEIIEKYPTVFEERKKNLYKYRYPNGESFYDQEMRLKEWLPVLDQEQGDVYIVCHASTIFLFMKLVFDWSFEKAKLTFISPASISCLERNDDGEWSSEFVDKQLLDVDFSHLEESMTKMDH